MRLDRTTAPQTSYTTSKERESAQLGTSGICSYADQRRHCIPAIVQALYNVRHYDDSHEYDRLFSGFRNWHKVNPIGANRARMVQSYETKQPSLSPYCHEAATHVRYFKSHTPFTRRFKNTSLIWDSAKLSSKYAT